MPTGKSDAFEDIAGALDNPMFIVTAATDDARAGCLVGFASQCSVDPARFMVFLSNKNQTYRVALQAQHLVVHVAPAERFELAELFGGETGDDIDKFERCEWRPGPGGAPVVDGCPAWFGGRVIERVPVGDHTGFLLEPLEGEAGEVTALGVQRAAAAIDPGHEA